MNKKAVQYIWAIVLMITITQIQAQDKVVVIPLFGDEAPTSKAVFLTKGAWQGNLGGPSGADAKCQAEADAPGSKVQGRSFKAWISGGLPEGFEHGTRWFNRATVPYKLVNGSLVAHDYADILEQKQLRRAIQVEASGLDANNSWVWTGLTEWGEALVDDCLGWQSAWSGRSSRVGISSSQSKYWTYYSSRTCEKNARLYCFEQ